MTISKINATLILLKDINDNLLKKGENMILLNGMKVEIEKFPNGETLINSLDKQIFISNMARETKMTVKFENNDDLINMIFIKKYLDEQDVDTILYMPYFPYSRMDRVESKSVFTLKYLSDIINSLKFKKVIILEPHSDVTPALINRCRIVNVTLNLLEYRLDDESYILLPDQGAEKRYGKYLNVDKDKILVGIKKRNFKTGRIESLSICGDIIVPEFKAIIVDDLCSKGGTFMMSAKKLRELGATKIILVVAHCEDTIFEGDILKTGLIDEVITTNSILTKKHDKISVISAI